MKESRDRSYLVDILTSAREIKEFVKDGSFENFDSNRAYQLAVVKSFEIIGEATKSLAKELRTNHPEIPWKDMSGLRDILVHRYRDADNEILFKMAREDIPTIISKIEKIIDEL